MDGTGMRIYDGQVYRRKIYARSLAETIQTSKAEARSKDIV